MLKLTAAETARRIVKEQFDVVRDEAIIRNWMSSSPPTSVCRVLLLGKSCTGKSALINAIAGEEIAEESHARKGGKGVEVYRLAVGEQSLLVVESPGLFDGDDREEGHIADIKSTVGRDASKFHLILVCRPITCTDFTDEDVKLVKLFTDILGIDLWNRAIVTLTFVNTLQPNQQQLQEQLDVCTTSVREGLEEAGLPLHVAMRVPLTPVGFHKPVDQLQDSYSLPDGTDWLHNLWDMICHRVSREATSILKSLETERFVPLGYVSVDI